MNNIGGKARGLLRLKEAGFPVPAFRAFSGEEILRMTPDELAREAHTEIGALSYSVRSSAEIEDTAESSMAGQFHTELDIVPKDLASAIIRVREQARGLVGARDFGIVIQAFIRARYSGVLFTRDPLGGREMTLQYVKGRGDTLVSGEKNPITERVYRNDTSNFSKRFYPLKEHGLKIEKLFGFPQDIEWVYDGKGWYFVQSRPITTLSKEGVDALEYLESILPAGLFYYEKTDATEIAPLPSKATFALIEKIHAKDGPAQRVYRKHGVTFSPRSMYLTFDGQLYVDREKELQSIFPAYSYFNGNDLTPQPAHIKGLYGTLKNLLALQRARFDVDALQKELFDRIQNPSVDFMDDYAIIFEINLATKHAFRALERHTKQYSILELLAMDAGGTFKSPSVSMEGLVGNGLALEDDKLFYKIEFSEPIQRLRAPQAKTDILCAQRLERLREYGRWLTVIHVNRLRATASFESVCPPARRFGVDFPEVLTSIVAIQRQKTVGVSAGLAEGTVVTTEEVDRLDNPILFVDQLSPNLTQYFGKISGIISTNGGLLSHLAIVAREAGIPVVVTQKAKYYIGREVKMNGSTGAIQAQ